MKRILTAVAIAALSQVCPAAACNREAAQDVKSMMTEFAKSHQEGDHIAVHWVYKIEAQPEAKRAQMVKTYADMDACLAGGAREIMFYRKEKLMAIASPITGIRLIK